MSAATGALGEPVERVEYLVGAPERSGAVRVLHNDHPCLREGANRTISVGDGDA